MRILITGGAGFIGSILIRYILNNTHDSIVNIDKLTYAGNLYNLTDVKDHPRYIFKQIDICDRQAIENIFIEHKFDAVMHLAAESHVDRSIDSASEFIKTNITGTYILLEVARTYWSGLGIKNKASFRFHHISTDEVYGELPHPEYGAINLEKLFNESSCYAPSSPYSASKASSDHFVRAWHRTYGLPIIITNCSNNYGPYQFPEKLIPHMIINALQRKALPVYGKGNQIRDWLYVEDHARALYLCLKKGVVGDTYNIGGHNEKQNIEVIHEVCDLLDEIKPSNSPYKSLITHVDDRPGHDLRYAIDATKILKTLDWQPQETFESGLRKTVLWYLDNELWWQNILSGAYRMERLGTQKCKKEK